MNVMSLQLIPPIFGPIAPPPGVIGALTATFQTFLVATSFSHERNNPTEYSKFASQKQQNPISSQNGMFRIYVPSAVVASIQIVLTYGDVSAFSFANLLLCIHFWKRTLEVAFVHRYSGTMPASSGNTIGIYYALFTLMIGAWAVPGQAADPHLTLAGFTLFAAGLLGNGYHHWLLSKLRSTVDPVTQKKKYVPPKGGLFSLVAAPHYMFELVGWLGIAFVAQQVNAFLTFGSMSAYLAARACLTNDKYMKDFTKEEWPRSRKALVPFIF